VRPVIADEGKSEQFLAAKRITLDPASRSMFLDYIARDFFAAFSLLARRPVATTDLTNGLNSFRSRAGPPMRALCHGPYLSVGLKKLSLRFQTVDRWRGVFLKLESDVPSVKAMALLPEQLQAWANGLIGPDRSAHTVMDVWVRACRTVFAWAVTEKLLARNPFIGRRLRVPRKFKLAKARLSRTMKPKRSYRPHQKSKYAANPTLQNAGVRGLRPTAGHAWAN
jgi:hypothetical protein